MNTERTTIIVKLAGALACVGLAFSGMADAAAAADPGDIPEVDEQYAFEELLAAERETELCTLLDREWTQKKPSMYLLLPSRHAGGSRGGFKDGDGRLRPRRGDGGRGAVHAEMFEAIAGMDLV